MRLLTRMSNGELEFVFVHNGHTPPYATLSHTWTDGQEVTYDELMAGMGRDKSGYAKIIFCLHRAAMDGISYVWVDTCCINKSSQWELQTAVISMFQWYQNATRCYAYLSDVSVPDKVNDAQADPVSWLAAFQRSRWFTRGWTLQELLAPDWVEFFSQEGKLLGNKTTLEREIHAISKIPITALRKQRDLHEFTVEDIASWTMHRQTTLGEDRAYCLLGIFGVSMSILYGEGQKNAVRRLDREVRQAAQSDEKRHMYRRQSGSPLAVLSSGDDHLCTCSDQLHKNGTMRIRLLRYNQSGGLELVNFGCRTPPYAVLSHRWTTHEEVTYQDLVAGTGKDKAGFKKIRSCGDRAAEDGIEYFWVDTCCINKSTVDEESTAINSMFRWYRSASKCYVYLADVHILHNVVDAVAEKATWQRMFQQSGWFSRGWTLQELLAPAIVEFFSAEWVRLGDKASLEQEINTITKIPVRALRGHDLKEFSFDERISWAVNRVTTRPEDKAYCLSGFFDVFVPTIYGEGEENALRRLQEEVQHATRWKVQEDVYRIHDESGLFRKRSVDGHSVHYTNMRARLLRFSSHGGLELVDYSTEGLPPYAVLSHRWAPMDDELTYEDLLHGTGKDKPGYAKARIFGEHALQDGINYFWMDTCCINKSDRDELSTAINCMFRWYRGASKCYVYLADVHILYNVVDAVAKKATWQRMFQQSGWFSRGWTLQELLAPAIVEFFSAEWVCLGDKASLEQEINTITKIPVRALRGHDLKEFSFDERISWAVNRVTTLPEDGIYCLLGLFGVYMPLIHGEGYDKAFRRLADGYKKR